MSADNKFKYKVSICIPAYKQPDFLRRTLQSVFIQTFSDYEIIISDDSPDDSVEKIVAEFQPSSKIVYFRNKIRKGSPENWNAAISQSSGEYIKILHHDDYFSRKDSLYIFVKMLDEHPESDFAFSGNIVTDIHQNAIYCHSATLEQAARVKKDPKYLFLGNYVGSPSCIIYRSNVQEKFDTHLKWVVDIDFYIAVLQKNTNFVFVSDPLICCSLGVPGQLTSECLGNKSIEIFEWIYLYKKIDDSLLPDCHRVLFIWNLLRRYKIKSTEEIPDGGSLPGIIRLFILLQKANCMASVFKSSVIKIIRSLDIYLRWILSGKPIPPPHLIKQLAIKRYGREYKISVLIETGTYLGEMIEAAKCLYKKIYSIELSDLLYRDAVNKFANDKNVIILNGDSAKIIPEILSEINERCIFWLDAHYSAGITAKGDKDTPILCEIEHILNHSVKGHVILIDDARLFNGNNHYPTLDNLFQIVRKFDSNSQIQVKDDIIRLT